MLNRFLVAMVMGLFITNAAAAGPTEVQAGAAKAETSQRRQVHIVIPPENLATLPPEDQRLLGEVVQSLTDRFWTWDASTFDTTPPEVSFGPGADIIPLSQLFAPPATDEAAKLGEEGIRFTDEQLSEIHELAIFKVPSKQYPGLFYVWKVSTAFQKGAQAIEVTWQHNRATAVEDLMVRIPRRLFGDKPISIRHGLLSFLRGLYGVADLFVGFNLQKPKYTANDIVHMVVDLRRTSLKHDDTSSVSLTEDETRKVFHLLNQIEIKTTKANAAVNQQLWQDILTELEAKGLKDEELFKTASAQLEAKMQEQLLAAIRSDESVKAFRADLPDKLYSYGHVLALLRLREQEFAVKMDQKKTEIVARLQAQTPRWQTVVNQDFIEEHAAAEALVWYRSNLWTMYADVVAEARQQGFEDGAAELESQIAFLKAEAVPRVEQWTKEVAPLLTQTADLRIWRHENWKIEQTAAGQFHLKKTRQWEVSSDGLGWRLLKAAQNTAVTGWNGTYHLLVTNLWNGPLSIRSLTEARPFQYMWEVDASGRLVQSAETRATLLSRIAAVRTKGDDIIRAQRERTDVGMLGKGFGDAVTWVKADLGLKLLAPAGLTLGQGLATVVNGVGSAVLTAGVVVWAPLSGLLQYAGDMILVDPAAVAARKTPHSGFRYFAGVQTFPLVRQLGLVLGGATETVVGVPVASAYHLTSAATNSAGGWARKYVRALWDAGWRSVIRKWGRIPGRDTFAASKISGPGVERNFFFSVQPSLALAGVLAELESLHVELSYEQKSREIAEPLTAAKTVIQAYQNLFGPINISRNIPAIADILDNQTALEEQLDGSYEDLRKQISNWTVLPAASKDRVRMSDTDLAAFRAKALVLTQGYVSNNIFSKMDASAQKGFWKWARCSEGNWEQLTDDMIVSVFGKNILTPLDKEGNDFVVAVHDSGVEDWVDGILNGSTPSVEPVVTDATERNMISSSIPARERSPAMSVVGATAICSSLLGQGPLWKFVEPDY